MHLVGTWNKVEMVVETILYQILWHYKRKVTNEKNLLVNLIVNLITKYHKFFSKLMKYLAIVESFPNYYSLNPILPGFSN